MQHRRRWPAPGRSLMKTRILFDNRRALHPRRSNIALDANALNRHGTKRDTLVVRFDRLSEDGVLRVVLAGGVRDEAQHPNSPARKTATWLPKLFNLAPGHTSST